MPDHIPLAIFSWLPAYIAANADWSWNAASAFVLANLSPIAGASAVSGGLITWLRTRAWDALIGGLAGAVAGPLVILAVYFAAGFLCYPIVHDAALQARIAELGGAPDAPVLVPRNILTDKDRIVSALTSLSAFMNVEGREACDKADYLQRNMTNIEETARRLDDSFARIRSIYETLFGQENKSGMLKGGDPQILEVLAVVIQPKDYNIIYNFDSYTNQLSQAFKMLNRASGSPFVNDISELLQERIRHFRDYKDKFCMLIEKTNTRVAELRKKLTR